MIPSLKAGIYIDTPGFEAEPPYWLICRNGVPGQQDLTDLECDIAEELGVKRTTNIDGSGKYASRHDAERVADGMQERAPIERLGVKRSDGAEH